MRELAREVEWAAGHRSGVECIVFSVIYRSIVLVRLGDQQWRLG
jgi:hypothetical protein